MHIILCLTEHTIIRTGRTYSVMYVSGTKSNSIIVGTLILSSIKFGKAVPKHNDCK